SLRLPVGPYHSSFRKTSGPTSAVTRFSRTRGVRPTASAIDASALRDASHRIGMAPDCTRVGPGGPGSHAPPGGWRHTPRRSSDGRKIDTPRARLVEWTRTDEEPAHAGAATGEPGALRRPARSSGGPADPAGRAVLDAGGQRPGEDRRRAAPRHRVRLREGSRNRR